MGDVLEGEGRERGATLPCDGCFWPTEDTRDEQDIRDGIHVWCEACLIEGKAWSLRSESDLLIAKASQLEVEAKLVRLERRKDAEEVTSG